MYEHMGFTHVAMWSHLGKNLCILLAPRRCCLGALFGSVKIWGSRRTRMGVPLPVWQDRQCGHGDPQLLDKFRKIYLVNQVPAAASRGELAKA